MRPKITDFARRLRSPDFLIGAGIFLFALALRWWGVWGSLPYVGHPDEPKLIDSAVHMIKSGDLNPHIFIWPSLYFYLEALVIHAHVLYGALRHFYAGPQSLPDVSHVFSLAPGVYVWARTLTALVGATTVALLYTVGKEMFNGSRRVGVAAALMLAVSPLHIEYSHYALTDVPLGLAGLLVLWASYRLSRTRPVAFAGSLWRDPLIGQSALCGLLVGVATGTKYNGLYLGVVPLIAWLIAFQHSRNVPRGAPDDPQIKNRATAARSRLFLALLAIPVAGLVGFLLCEPYAILDWPSFYQGFTFQVQAYVPAHNLQEVVNSIQEHISDLSVGDMYFFLPSLLGAFVLVFNPPVRNRAWLLVPFPVLYTLAMSRFSLVYVRNLIVTLPFLAIISGYLIDIVAMQVASLARSYLPIRGSADLVRERRFWDSVRWALLVLAIAITIAEPLRISSEYTLYMGDPESRNLAWTWMQERMKAGDRFAAELHPWQTQDWPDVLAFDVENPDSANPLTTRPPDWYALHGYNLLVLSSNVKDSKRDSKVWPLYQKLPVVKLFAGDKEGGKGPTITVLASSPDATSPADAPMMVQTNATFEDFASLKGYDLLPVSDPSVLVDPSQHKQAGQAAVSQEEFKRGQAIGLNLYFSALRDGHSSDPNWQVWVHLVDRATGNTVSQISVTPLTGQLREYPKIVQQPHAVAQWHRGEFVPGVYNLPIPADAPAGDYRLEMGMWVPPSGPGAHVTGQPGDRVVLGDFAVR